LMYERVCLCELLKIVVDTKHLNEWLRRAEEERSNQSHLGYQGNRKYYWFGAKVYIECSNMHSKKSKVWKLKWSNLHSKVIDLLCFFNRLLF
jgi:hypothetical protein